MLASEGMLLFNFNVEGQCAPSRFVILTGRCLILSGTRSVPIGDVANGLTQWEVTIAESLPAGSRQSSSPNSYPPPPSATGHFPKSVRAETARFRDGFDDTENF